MLGSGPVDLTIADKVVQRGGANTRVVCWEVHPTKGTMRGENAEAQLVTALDSVRTGGKPGHCINAGRVQSCLLPVLCCLYPVPLSIARQLRPQ